MSQSFFDPAYDVPREFTAAKIDEEWNRFMDFLESQGLPPEKIYASRKTGLIPTAENWKLLSARDKADWAAAVKEYRQRNTQ